jgi:hypothetical protein
VPPGDDNALAAAVGRLLEDRDLAAQLGADGKAHLEQNYALPFVVTSLERLYREVSTVGGAR